MKPIKKFQTAAGGGTVAIIIAYLVGLAGIEMSLEVAAAFGAVIGAGLTWLTGYLQRDPVVDAGKKAQQGR
jgi:hypothetical protein